MAAAKEMLLDHLALVASMTCVTESQGTIPNQKIVLDRLHPYGVAKTAK